MWLNFLNKSAMSDLTDVKFFLASLIRPIVKEAVREEFNALNTTPATAPDADPYGDFKWLAATCSGVPASTLRIKSAAGEIPGVVKFGKRVLYDKATVLNWLRSQIQKPAPGVAELDRITEEQINSQLAKL